MESENYKNLDFYDIFERFYKETYGKDCPYTMNDDLSIGNEYEIAAEEFENVIIHHFKVSPKELRTLLRYDEDNNVYIFRPRGFVNLTTKGYFIYEDKNPMLHASAFSYFRISPMSYECRSLTDKYLKHLDFQKYKLMVCDWNEETVHKLLMPGMFGKADETKVCLPLFEKNEELWYPQVIVLGKE